MLNLQSVYFGQKHPNFDYKDFDLIKRIQRLSRKHQRQCENDCNGEGWVRGRFFRCDGSTEGAYLPDTETTVFQAEIDRIEKHIWLIIKNASALNHPEKFKVEFQHDPRGSTVKLYYENEFIEL
jgi:hypothetical protein